MKENVKKTLKKKAKSFFQKINIFYVKISKYKWVLKTCFFLTFTYNL